MSELFSSGYAAAYDAFYTTKDYAGECDLIEEIFRRYAREPIVKILDLGCGTGNHALRLAARGYEVTAVDQSPHMLAEAERKAAASSLAGKVSFHQADVRDFNLDLKFDAIVVMFAVLGYQLENKDVSSTLKSARNHLKRDGLLVFDVWYGPGVLHQRPAQRIKTIKTENGEILRISAGTLDVNRQTCTADIQIWNLEHDRVVDRTAETHTQRYFFPLELKLFLEQTGFDPIRLGAFPDFNLDPDESTWNVLQVARAA
ncbi:MAG TPA: class I SAM-dependent methyltransferase [Pyrinomonadaceae bacterium]|nr:class I SAM-dependent methyltransferase [Pyrinomonadaceae bacterium]